MYGLGAAALEFGHTQVSDSEARLRVLAYKI